MNRTSEYFAGLFDGEGTIGIYSVHKRNWYARLALVGTHKPMIEECQKFFKVGSVRTQKRQVTHKTPTKEYVYCKQGWRWLVTNKKDIKDILEKIAPFLIEKKEQAEIVLAYLNNEIYGEDASLACKTAKKFTFPLEGEEPPPNTTKGKSPYNAKLTWEQAEAVREEYKNGVKKADLAIKYKISKTNIGRLIAGNIYATKPLYYLEQNKKLS